MEYSYRIYDEVYNDILSGKKNVEFRLLNEKSSSIKIGDKIKFVVIDNENKYLITKVIDKFIYDNLDSLCQSDYYLNNNLNCSKTEFIAMFNNMFGEENVKNSKITKLENGIFEVTMPVPTDLEGKNLAIYYVTEDGKVEEHEVTIKDGYATFQTNHFSIYTLAEKTNSIVNPKTGDNISLYIILSISSLIMLTVCSICLSNKNKRVKNN